MTQLITDRKIGESFYNKSSEKGLTEPIYNSKPSSFKL